MRDPRVDRMAENIVNYSCKIAPGDKVMIESQGDHNDDLVKALIRAIYAAGGMPFVYLRKMDIQRELLMHATEGQLKTWAEGDKLLMSHMDGYIRMRGEENTSELGDVPAENMEKYAKLYQKPVLGMRGENCKWCVMHYPTDGAAQAERMSTEQFEDYFFDVCAMDYSRMQAALKPLKELMEKTDKVHVTGRGTDLTFSIKGMPAVPCAGEVNIPDGEIFAGPVLDSVNGVITYNTTAYFDGVAFENICFHFENGRIVEATANDTERLNQILDRDEGCRRIGEFAIGLNPYVTRPMKDSMFNEKMTGSIHFTPGNSITESDNGNRASIHWDIVFAQTPEYGGGDIWFDDVLIRHDGRFVLPELEGLNPENLR